METIGGGSGLGGDGTGRGYDQELGLAMKYRNYDQVEQAGKTIDSLMQNELMREGLVVDDEVHGRVTKDHESRKI